jgi:hypothetical protein
MWLEDGYDNIDSGEPGWEKSQETAKEAQEKKEKSSKAIAWIQRTRKDEKKAQKDNDILFEIIVDIIRNKDYDVILPFVIDLIRIWIPSNLILWVISLIFDEATYIIRNNYFAWNHSIVIDTKKSKEFRLSLNYTKTDEVIEFDDNNINETIKNRINEWIEDIINVISYDPSSIITNKFFILMSEWDNRKMVINYITWVITFFLFKLNISIEKWKAFRYSEYILDEVVRKLKSLNLEQIDQ